MKISLRMLLVSLPVVVLGVMLIGIASVYMTNAHASGQQETQAVTHVAQVSIPQHITDSAVNLNKCDNGPQSNCSVLTQLNEGDIVLVHCQTAAGSSWWSYADAPDYGNTGWVSNNALSGGPAAIRGVPACSAKK